MTGKSLTLDGISFNNPALKYLRDDVVLPKQGALMLIDPTNPANPWAAGLPVDGTFLPNIALSQARALYGAVDTDAQAKAVVNAAFTGTAGKLERTGKGGLHGIAPKAGTALANTGAGLILPNKLISYILANPQHDYYMSMWWRTTREPLAGFNNSQLLSINGNAQQTNSYLFNVAPNSGAGPAYPLNRRPSAGVAPQLGAREDGTTTALGNKYVSIATDYWYSAGVAGSLPGDGTNTTVTGAQAGGGISFGSFGNWTGIGSNGVEGAGTFNPGGSSTNKDKNASQILYRFYLEDLTVSGRTHADVDAISYAEYTKQVLTAGGRYYGDTFTDPATIP